MNGNGRYRSGLVRNSVGDVSKDEVRVEGDKFIDWCTGVLNSPVVRHEMLGILLDKGTSIGNKIRILQVFAMYGSARPTTTSVHTSVSLGLDKLPTRELAAEAYRLIKELGFEDERVVDADEIKKEEGGKESGEKRGEGSLAIS